MIIVKSDLRNNLLFGKTRKEDVSPSRSRSGPTPSLVLCPWLSSTPSDKASMSIIGWGRQCIPGAMRLPPGWVWVPRGAAQARVL